MFEPMERFSIAPLAFLWEFGGEMCTFLVEKCVYFWWRNVYIFCGEMWLFEPLERFGMANNINKDWWEIF